MSRMTTPKEFPEQVQLLYRQAMPGFATTIGNAFVLCVVLREALPLPRLAAWFALAVAVTLLRLVLVVAHDRHPSTSRGWLWGFVATTALAGATWGLAGSVLLPSDNLPLQLFVGFLIAGMTAGGAQMLSSVWGAYLAFLLPATLPFAWVFFAHGGQIHIAIALMTLLYVVMMVSSSRRMAHALERSLQLVRDNVALNSHLMADVEDRKQHALALEKARDEALEGTRLKSEFLSTISHELRTPMNGIIGMTDLLLDTHPDAVQRDYLETLRASSSSLLTLLNDILDFSKSEAGKLTISETVFDPKAIAADVLKLQQPAADAKGLELRGEISELPAAVLGDAGRLRQVLLNFLGNAVKFTPHGEVVLRAWVESSVEPARLHFEVQDHGIGIPDSARKHLFQPFVQADGSTTRKYGGTGLGLAISRRLVELMGGQVGFESEEGQGSRFWAELPLRLARAEEAIEAPRAGVMARAKLLLVEDNLVNQKVGLAQLKRLGMDVDVAPNGSQAVEAVARGGYDLVLMDCQMPVMDGFEATRTIRSQEAGHMPIIALTADALEQDAQRCREAGMDDHLGKPFTLEQLRLVLERWLPANEVGTGLSE